MHMAEPELEPGSLFPLVDKNKRRAQWRLVGKLELLSPPRAELAA